MVFGSNFTRLRTIGFLGAAAISSVSLCSVAFAYAEKTLYTFCSVKHCADGSVPAGDLAMDQTGNLYGTTEFGGNDSYFCNYYGSGCGVVFEFSPSTGKYSVLYTFCSLYDCTDGAYPLNVKLVIDKAGNLYGTASGAASDYGRVVFELVRGTSGWQEKTLYAFCSRRTCHDGASPGDGLTYSGAASGQPYDGKSPLYGTTYSGGASGEGAVFALSPVRHGKKWKETVLYSFCAQANCADGAYPETPLYLDSAGNLYGTTGSGGQSQYGTVFELSPNSTIYSESVLYSFCAQTNCVDGGYPSGGVLTDGSGNLFGTAKDGGSAGLGVVFELSPNGSELNYSVLDNFNGTNGSYPLGRMIFGSDGNLYGTTYGGGANQKGTVFTFNGTIQSLYSFCNGYHCPDGKQPVAGVVQDSTGNLFGTTPIGGAKHHGVSSGTLYELSP